MTKFKAGEIELEELAAFLLGRDLESFIGEDGEYEGNLWNEFYNQFRIEEKHFTHLVNQLMPLITVGKSPLTGNTYKGFADAKNGFWLVKMRVKE